VLNYRDKDWNAIARKNTFASDPIGSKRSSMQRHSQRSLRKKIIEQANEGLQMNQNQLIGKILKILKAFLILR